MIKAKTKTMKLQGNDYAQVKDRLKEFRQENPRGLIETSPTIQDDGTIMFRARIMKDKADISSAEATGHAYGTNKSKKDFEKLETIAVGRALALLGYATDGEIASSEEMEQFNAWQDKQKEAKIATITKQLKSAKNMDELVDIWNKIDGEYRPNVLKVKDDMKKKYETA